MMVIVVMVRIVLLVMVVMVVTVVMMVMVFMITSLLQSDNTITINIAVSFLTIISTALCACLNLLYWSDIQ